MKLSVTVSFRIPRELKSKMDMLRSIINWSEEVRKFIESRIEEYEQLKAIEELEEIIESIKLLPRGTAIRYVREDRDSY
ncbi:MAG: CopG family transcriptional regulator [archaeon GB-1867-005]|nr:CopG family transcriptional regulator [Candidatus Culexmicrobium cathedralense]